MPDRARPYFAFVFFFLFSLSWLHQWHFLVTVHLCVFVCVSVLTCHFSAECATYTSDRCMYRRAFSQGTCGM